MKIEALKKILKETVREVFQEEIKDLLLEAMKSPKPVINEITPSTSTPTDKKAIRESYMNVLGDMQKQFTTQNITTNQPLQVTSTDTTSNQGRLPEGNVSMDQIMGLMNK